MYRNTGSFRERLIADEFEADWWRDRGLFGRVNLLFGPVATYLVAIFLLGTLLAHEAGKAKGETQTEHLVLPDAPDVAVIRVYNDKIIAVPFDCETRTLRSQLVIRKIDADAITLRLEQDVGPLKRPKTKPTVSETSTS